jgi:hypothetical protein
MYDWIRLVHQACLLSCVQKNSLHG